MCSVSRTTIINHYKDVQLLREQRLKQAYQKVICITRKQHDKEIEEQKERKRERK